MSATRKASHQRGYTVVEVMMALSVLTIAAFGVVAMQKTAVVGNMRARNLATANAIASTWIERLRADAMQWSDANNTPNIGDTEWLNVVGTDFPTVDGLEGKWFRPDIADFGTLRMSPMADVRGVDTDVQADGAFCTHLRLTQLLPTMIRVEVRVVWLRRGGGGTLGGKTFCEGDAQHVNDVGMARDRYHFVYITSAVLRNEGIR